MSTVHGSSSTPGSVKLIPVSVTLVWQPTDEGWKVGFATVGATFATVAWKVAVPLAPAPFSSSTVIVTVYAPSSTYVWALSVIAPRPPR